MLTECVYLSSISFQNTFAFRLCRGQLTPRPTLWKPRESIYGKLANTGNQRQLDLLSCSYKSSANILISSYYQLYTTVVSVLLGAADISISIIIRWRTLEQNLQSNRVHALISVFDVGESLTTAALQEQKDSTTYHLRVTLIS